MYTLDPKIVGKIFAEIREQKNLTQEVVSGFAAIGRTHLSDIERGIKRPTMETFCKLCNALDVKMSTVMLAIEKELEQKK